MSLSYSAFFDARRGYYRARRWGRVGNEKVDGAVRIPDEWWHARGFDPPKQASERSDKMALRFAAAEAQRLEDERNAAAMSATGSLDKMNITQVFQLMKADNPRLVGNATMERWEYDFGKLTEFVDPKMLPENVTVSLATQYRNWRMKQNREHTERRIRSRTIRNELIFLRQLVRFALDWQDATGAAVIRFNRLPEIAPEDSLQVALTVPQFAAALEVASDRNREILVCGVTTMLRKSNLLSLDASQIDMKRRWLRVDRAAMKGRAGNKRDLEIPITRWFAGMIAGRKGALFRNERTDEPLTWITRTLDTIVAKANEKKKIVPSFSLHDLRTTGASWLHQAGVDDLTIGRLLGHAPPQQSNQKSATPTYLHTVERQLRDAVAVFDDIHKKLGS